MQSGLLLAAENERLQKDNERQKRKRQIKRRFFSKKSTLTVEF
jgi:hypothetical protein